MQLPTTPDVYLRESQPYFAIASEPLVRTGPDTCSTVKCKVMEFLNRIVLRGVVGRAETKSFNGNTVCNFSVVTEASVVDKDRNSTIENTWFNVSAWEGPVIKDLYLLQKGLWVEVIGRVRIKKYTTQDNEERSSMDILARSVSILPREDASATMQPQKDY